MLAGVLVAGVLVAVWRGWLWRLDLVLYDAQLRLWHTPPQHDIVIVAVDEASLAELGRWPWPRRVHAALLERLREAGVRAVALDLIFAEPDASDPEGDRLLAEAVAGFPGVVLPVLVEQAGPGGVLVERLPLPALAAAADGLGHVHVELDADGIARSQFLMEGLGEPRWPALAVALLEQASGQPLVELPGQRRPAGAAGTSGGRGRWVRDHRVLVPFGGGVGHFARLSYAQVLDGAFLPQELRGRMVLVGVTAAGLGDFVPTPVSGHQRHMPGVEFNAHVLQALRAGTAVTPLPMAWQQGLAALLVLLPLLAFPRLRPRQALLAALAGTLLPPLLSLALLVGLQLWLPPAAAMVGAAIAYPLWSWRRLEGAVRYLERELAVVQRETEAQASLGEPVLPERVLPVVCELIGAAGWQVRDGSTLLGSGGEAPAPPLEVADVWRVRGDGLWIRLQSQAGERWMGVAWPPATEARAAQSLLDQVAARCRVPPRRTRGDAVELLESRIGALQRAAAEVRAARAMVDDALAHMRDGLVLADCCGVPLVMNAVAARRFGIAPEPSLMPSLLVLLQRFTPLDGGSWRERLGTALVYGRGWQQSARDDEDRELLVGAEPLAGPAGELLGVVVTFTDVTTLRETERHRAELLGFLSHDLRSPLHSVLALIELARNQGEGGLGTLERIEKHTRGTLALADQFLDLTRAESGVINSNDDVDLVGLVLDARDQVWAQAQTRGVRLDLRITCDEAFIRGDARLITRAVINLLGNAVKWSPGGTAVELGLSADADTACIRVRDRGPGIPFEEQPRLFRRFSRVTPSAGEGQRPGVGLGLALVKAVAEAHGGRVSVQSRPGQGATFELRLPLAPEPAPVEASAAG